MTEALIALGGNVGDSPHHSRPRRRRCCATASTVQLTARSSDYRTPPWGVKYQPPFINLCIAVDDHARARASCWRTRSKSN